MVTDVQTKSKKQPFQIFLQVKLVNGRMSIEKTKKLFRTQLIKLAV